MGSGKSTLCREVARLRYQSWADTDVMVASRAGCTIPEIFAREGEAGFRQRELEVVEELVIEPRPHIIATGGGTFTQTRARLLLLSSCVVVYLRAPAEVLAARVSQSKGRPLLENTNDPLAKISTLLQHREIFYRLADFTVDVTNRSIAQLADILCDNLPA